MYLNALRTAALTTVVVVVGAMSVAATPASAGLTQTFTNWAVWGSLTPKKLNEPVTLPKGSTFNGSAEIATATPTEISGTLTGSLVVPPFKTSLKLGGVVPTTVGVTFTQVGKAEGTLGKAPAQDCPSARFNGFCVTVKVTAKANVGITAAGILGIEVPTHCETSEPITFPLATTLTLGELQEVGMHISGTVTIPPIKCEGLSGLVLGATLTELMSGPENPYVLHIGPQEPAPPTVVTKPATSISQVSASLHSTVNPNGEPETDCHFEYGTSTSYGASLPCAAPRPGDAFSESAVLGGLSEGATYHYRVVAANTLGTSDGADQTFTTLGSALPEYGQCLAHKGGDFRGGDCTGAPLNHTGSFEFDVGPAPRCVAEKKGQYANSTCTTKAKKAKKGKFETAPGPGYSSTLGAVSLEAPGLGTTVTCDGASAAGEVTGASAGVQRITLTGCELAGSKCTSEGPDGTPSGTPGVIVTNLLSTRLLGPVAPAGEVWLQLTGSEHEGYFAELDCEGPLLRIAGSLAGVLVGGVEETSQTSTTKFAAGSGAQTLSTERSEDGGTSWTAGEASILSGLSANTSASPVQIRP
jgi:hypothetical protein